MKTTDPRDQLDRKIDELLQAKPITPSQDFAQKVLAAAQEPAPVTTNAPSKHKTKLRILWPIAAAIAITLFTTFWLQLPTNSPDTNGIAQTSPTPTTPPDIDNTELNSSDLQEIFLLEEILLSLDNTAELDLNNLQDTLDTLILAFES